MVEQKIRDYMTVASSEDEMERTIFIVVFNYFFGSYRQFFEYVERMKYILICH